MVSSGTPDNDSCGEMFPPCYEYFSGM
ncbi:MAG: hypothetical protein QOJ99_4261, partial [Bryobacterales bacterium]|nr:hypothetical protein [Bryobacterales bacterium]